MPEFETDDEHTYFISRIFAHKAFRENEVNELENGYRNGNRKVKNDNISDENEYVSKKVDIKAYISMFKLKKRVKAQKILEEIMNNQNITLDQLVIKTEIPKSTLMRYITEMKKRGILTREGATKNGKWKIL